MFSDHHPIMAVCSFDLSIKCYLPKTGASVEVPYFRWDHAPLSSYYESTRVLMQPVLYELNMLLDSSTDDRKSVIEDVDRLNNKVIDALRASAGQFVPKRRKNFYKFWWNAELDVLKENAIASCKIWKTANKPKHGPIYDKYRQHKLLHKKRIKKEQAYETATFTNELHDCLLRKSGQDFWIIWKSKFDSKNNKIMQVDGISDSSIIVNKFAQHFEKVCTPHSVVRDNELRNIYVDKRSRYNEALLLSNKCETFSVGTIADLLAKMKNGKAAGLDEISCEHLKYSHPIVISILCKLFNLFVVYEHIPDSFGRSYTVPVPKINVYNRAVSVDDFRGISISPVVSKLFEHAILDRFAYYFITSDNQQGFKKQLSCRHVIYNVRNVIEHYIASGSTVNVCFLDLSKAFDRMNHHALFIKLMDKKFPIELLSILEQWFKMSFTCVKWNESTSYFLDYWLVFDKGECCRHSFLHYLLTV